MVVSACRSENDEKRDPHDSMLSNSIWLPDWRMQQSLRSTLEALQYGCVKSASPFWYEIDNAGTLTVKPGSDGLHIPDKKTIGLLKQNQALVTPTITTTLMPDAFIQLFSDNSRQLSLAKRITQEIIENGYDGIDLDLENIALTTDSAVAREVRKTYTRFCQSLSSELTRVNKLLTITVMPRWSDQYEVWRNKLIPAVYDYKALSAAASILRVMAYDQHAPNTPPGPVAGFEWVKSICHWTRQNVYATDRVEIGIPLYGRDWGKGTVKSVLFDNVTALLEKYPQSVVTYSANEKEETFSYTDAQGASHTVWYSSDQAVQDRLALIKTCGFRGAAFWAASYESPDLWRTLSELA